MNTTFNFLQKLNENSKRLPRLQYNQDIAKEIGVSAAVILNYITFYFQKDLETRKFKELTGNDTVACWRKQEIIAKQTGFSLSTVKRKIALLIEKGYLTLIKIKGFKLNFYQLGKKLLSILGFFNEEKQTTEQPKENNAAADETPKQASHFRQPETKFCVSQKQNLTQKVVSTFTKTFTPNRVANTPPPIDLDDEKAVCDYIEKTLKTTIDNLKQTGKYNRQNIYETGKLYLSGKQLDAIKRLNL